METARASGGYRHVELPPGPCQDQRCCLPPAPHIQKRQGKANSAIVFLVVLSFFVC